MGICDVIDSVILPHGNRGGLSFGWLTTVWLSYILSEVDHRMCDVESWSADHLVTLQKLLSFPVCQKDFTDDRLADVLKELSDDLAWEQIETLLGQRLIRVYNLQVEPVRLDSTSVSVYHEADESGLFRFGHSKDHRPDLPQFKVMLATLDPLGLPLTTLIVTGNEADDTLYLPAVSQAKEIVGCGGRLYVGDSKMSTKENRATIERQGDYYLAPLTMTGDVPELKQALLQEFLAGKHDHEIIRKTEILGKGMTFQKILAISFETERTMHATVSGERREWQERVLAVFSKVDEFLLVEYELERERRYIRSYKERQPRYETQSRYVIHVKRNEKAIKNARINMGWRLYATNAPMEKLPLVKAVEVYRASPTIERDFARLKGKSLGIRPLYVQREDHVKGCD